MGQYSIDSNTDYRVAVCGIMSLVSSQLCVWDSVMG